MLCQSFFRKLFVAFLLFADKKVKRRDASRMSQLAPRRIFRRYVIVIINQLRAIERILAYFLQRRRERFENTEDEISVTFSGIIMLSGVATSARKNVDDYFSA